MGIEGITQDLPTLLDECYRHRLLEKHLRFESTIKDRTTTTHFFSWKGKTYHVWLRTKRTLTEAFVCGEDETKGLAVEELVDLWNDIFRLAKRAETSKT